MYRLRDVLEVCDEKLLIVLDDFEFNFEGFDPVSLRSQTSRAALQLKPEAARVLRELEQAIAQSGREHRVIVTCRYRLDGLESRYTVLPLAGMDAAELDKKRQQLAVTGLIEAARKQKDRATVDRLTDWLLQVEAIADGNPRLLMALDRVLVSGLVDESAVLTTLESTREAFRSDVLAELLLGMVSAKGRAVLAKGLVFRLAVPIEVFKSVCGEVEIERSISLGLLEVMPEKTVRVSRVLPLVDLEDEQLAIVAAREIYRVWFLEAKTSTEEQRLETHRLAMAAKDGEIAGVMANVLSIKWRQTSRYTDILRLLRPTIAISNNLNMITGLAIAEKATGNQQKALELHQQVLKLCTEEDAQIKATTLHQIARIYADQGQVEQAIDLYQQSLAINEQIGYLQGKAANLSCMAMIYETQGQVKQVIDLYQQSLAINEQIGNVQGKAATLYRIAMIYADQGQVEQAIDLYQQSLAITEQIEHVQGKAATLNQMAGIYADQGQVKQSIDLYQQSLAIKEQIGDVQGKAATLYCMAGLYANQGQVEQAIDLYQQSLFLTEEIRDVRTKAITLAKMGKLLVNQGLDVTQGLIYMKQGRDILLHLKSPIAQAIQRDIDQIER